jgi:predicted dehydrogenase
MTMTVGLAIVGCGAVTRIAHVPVLGMLGADLVRVVAVCDPDGARAEAVAALVGGATCYTRLDQVLDDPDVQAVDICTPHALHADLAVQALEGGRHVLVEKPLATTFADGQRMVSAARQAGCVLAVNEQIRFGAGVRAARALIEQGAIGELVSVRAHRLFELPPPYAASGWRNDPSDPSAGILIDQGPHYVHLLRRMAGGVAGEITHASAMAASARAPAAVVHVRFDSGLLGELLLAWNVPTPPTAAVGYAFGTLGSLEIDRRDAALVVHDANGETRSDQTREGYLDTVAACIGDFLRAAAGQSAAAEMSGEEGLRDLAVVDAAGRSVTSGRLEEVFSVS